MTPSSAATSRRLRRRPTISATADAAPAEFTLCQATFTDQSYQQRISADDRFNIIEGDLEGERPGFPVVLAWDTDCAPTQLDTSWDVELASLDSLDDVNLAREVEVSLRAAALDSCLSLDEARAMAASARAELGEAWLLLDFEPEVPSECYAVDIDLQWGSIMAQGRDDGTPSGPDETTEPQG